MSDIAIKFSFSTDKRVPRRYYRASAGTYVLHGNADDVITSISCDLIETKSYVHIDIPFRVADWYCDKCIKEGLPSADLTKENIPGIMAAYKEATKEEPLFSQPNLGGARAPCPGSASPSLG